VLSSAGDLRGKRDAMSGALRFILIASIPAAVAMLIAGRPLVGVLVGGAIPARWDLDFVVPATFIALVFPTLKDKPMLAAALSAGAVAVLTAPLPHKLNVLLAAFVGIAVGMLVQRLGRMSNG
jgi:predicted branched-subunit amino acid permease